MFSCKEAGVLGLGRGWKGFDVSGVVAHEFHLRGNAFGLLWP